MQTEGGASLLPAMTRTSKPSEDILIVSAGVGAGHNSAAAAVAERFGQMADVDRPAVVDALDFTPGWFNGLYAGGFKLSMAHLPWLYGLSFRLSNRRTGPSRSLGERMRLALEGWVARRLGDELARRRPGVLLHTHFLSPHVARRLVAGGRLSARSAVLVTDVEVHRLWWAEGMDRWFVPADRSADQLMVHGVESSKITVTGIPVRPKWTQPIDRERALADWSLPADRPIVLVTGGAEFTCGPVLQMATDVLDRCDEAHVILLAGRNRRLMRQAAALADRGRPVSVVGFTERNHELVTVSDLMVTKAGGITTFECIASATPTVLYRPVPGQEEGNARFLADQGVGVVAHDPSDVADTVARLLAEPDRLAGMREACRQLHQPSAEMIARELIAGLD